MKLKKDCQEIWFTYEEADWKERKRKGRKEKIEKEEDEIKDKYWFVNWDKNVPLFLVKFVKVSSFIIFILAWRISMYS